MNFTRLLNKKLNILARATTQDASGQVFETWTPTLSNVPCRKDIAPKDYQITDNLYKNTTEKYTFFIDKKYYADVTRLNHIECEGIQYAVLDVMKFDSIATLHHIEIYAVKAELGNVAGLGVAPIDPSAFVRKTQTVNGKPLTGNITIEVADVPTLASELAGIQSELDLKQDIATNYDDKTYQQSFTAQTSVTVTHNLNKYPSVTIIDSSYSEIIGEIVHASQDQFTVTFSSATGGIIYCN